MDCQKNGRRKQSPKDGSDNGNPGITPVTPFFIFYGKKKMHNPGSQVPGRINRITRSAAERQSDGPDQKSNGQGTQRTQTDFCFGICNFRAYEKKNSE